jgi:hypothetical protein
MIRCVSPTDPPISGWVFVSPTRIVTPNGIDIAVKNLSTRCATDILAVAQPTQ